MMLCACAAAPLRLGQGPPLTPQALYAVTLQRAGGGRLHLSEFRGQVLMLDFFYTWSQPSLVAIVNYSVLQEKFGDRGLAVVGVALDELGDEVVAPFVAGMQIPYPVVLADRRIRSGQSIFGPLEAVPSLMIFDRQGRLAQIFVGLVPAERLERVVRELL